ncbi:MAG: aminomethyl-transferring glycine dehydrogenase subunit GcvPA [Planctomycetota bacterium]|nr:aminomethyl-transferring glycine dehydrogenase subunit GcvPA [Planctomycetota bacterium]
MAYTQNTPEEIREMLERIGADSIDELFAPIPKSVRFRGDLNLERALSEPEILRKMGEAAKLNSIPGEMPSFLGAGAYRHHIPSLVDNLAGRSEFATSYTPYQPEASQGNLQATYEYQTMICEITGMDVSNASHYDGATSAAEAALMALGSTGRNRVLIPGTLHPDTRAVLHTYLVNRDAEPVDIPLKDGRTDLDALRERATPEVAAIILQTPNFLGLIEEAAEVSQIAHSAGALMIAAVDPISLGLLAPPGDYDADIAVGEGQPLGNPVSFGGPWFGFLAARQKYVRRMPGRIVGETLDADGRRAYVLTLQAREQHIRRARATSNICTNQGLCALRGAIYLTTIGKEGFRHVAELCLQKAHYAADAIQAKTPFRPRFEGPFFREFSIHGPVSAKECNQRLFDKGIIGGFDLGRVFPQEESSLLLSFTEMNTREEIDFLVWGLSEIS